MSPMPGIFCIAIGHRVVHQPGDRERLSVAQLDLGLGAARRERRHAEALERDRVGEVERADFGLDLEVDQVAAEHGRREVQADAELLEHDRDRVARRSGPARPG